MQKFLMFSVFSVLFLCNQVFGVLYSGPFKSDGSNLPPGAVTKNYSTSTPVTINATGAQNALNVVGTSNIASVLYVNKSTSRVGVGTSAPTTLLSVNGVASFGAGTALLPSIAAFGDLNTGAWFPAADTFAVSTGGSERLRVDSSGRVGLGNSQPLGRLDMGSGTDANGTNYISWSSGGAANAFNIFPIRGGFGLSLASGYRASPTSSDSFISSIDGSVSRSLISARSGEIRLYTDPASTVAVGSSITPTERMRIDSAGNMGIGTTAPNASAILDVQSTTKGLRLPNMTAAQMYAIVSPAAGLMIWNTSSTNVSVYTGSAWANVKDL